MHRTQGDCSPAATELFYPQHSLAIMSLFVTRIATSLFILPAPLYMIIFFFLCWWSHHKYGLRIPTFRSRSLRTVEYSCAQIVGIIRWGEKKKKKRRQKITSLKRRQKENCYEKQEPDSVEWAHWANTQLEYGCM